MASDDYPELTIVSPPQFPPTSMLWKYTQIYSNILKYAQFPSTFKHWKYTQNFLTHDDINYYKSGSGVSFKSDIIIIKLKRVKVSCCQLCALTSSLCNLTFHIPDGNNLPMF